MQQALKHVNRRIKRASDDKIFILKTTFYQGPVDEEPITPWAHRGSPVLAKGREAESRYRGYRRYREANDPKGKKYQKRQKMILCFPKDTNTVEGITLKGKEWVHACVK